jgi:hypothetical protein
MFNNNILDLWLDKKATEIVTAMGEGKPLSPEDMMVLMLKAQTNHFNHLDIDMRSDMKTLREDIDKRFQQIDKRFEQIDKRFEQIVSRMDSMMI